MMKDGHLTSEFWLTVLVIICVTALLIFRIVTPDQITALIPLVLPVVGYQASRGLVKYGNGNNKSQGLREAPKDEQ